MTILTNLVSGIAIFLGVCDYILCRGIRNYVIELDDEEASDILNGFIGVNTIIPITLVLLGIMLAVK